MVPKTTAREIQLWSRQRADLGESPRWDADRERLLWVDITAGRVHASDESGTELLAELPGRASAVAQRAQGGLLVATNSAVVVIDEQGDALEGIAVEDPSADRCLNDAAVDAHGRWWIGSAMARDYDRARAGLFRLDPSGCTAMLGGVCEGNGIGWSPDDRHMYFADSHLRRIDVFDFDLDAGALGERRTFATVAHGLPDGLAVDADGCVWVAIWGAGEVHRYDPDGRLLQRVALPVSRPSSCAFGGPDLRDLFVTSARMGVERPDATEPLAGSIFRLPDAGRGLPSHRAAL